MDFTRVTTPPPRKRTYSDSLVSSTPWSSGAVSEATSSTSVRKDKRRRATVTIRYEVEEAFKRRYNHFDFIGHQGAHRKLDPKPKFSDRCYFFNQFMEQHKPPLEHWDPDSFTFVKSNSLVQLNHLESFNRPAHLCPEQYQEAVALVAAYVDHLLTLDERIPFPMESDLAEVPYIGDRFAGIEYARMGLKTRREANDLADIHAVEAWRQLLRGERVEPQLNRIGGRGKLAAKKVVEAMGDKLNKGRLVMMTGHRDLKLNGVTEKLLTRAYKRSDYPIGIGQSWWHGGVEGFLHRFTGFTKYWCFDAKKFDSSLPGWLVRIAIRIVRAQFVDGESSVYDAYWQFIYDGLVEAPMFIDNGLVFRRFGGSTSGHNHNTLIQSVCTVILFYVAFVIIFGIDMAEEVFSKVWGEGSGDDNVGGAKPPFDVTTKEEISAVVMKVAGIDWSGDKSFETDMLVDEEPGAFDGIQYLGKYFRVIDEFVDGFHFAGVIPYRPTLETLQRLLYPEHETSDPEGAWERAVGHYADAAGNDITRVYLEAYLDWLEPQVTSREVAFSEKWRRKFTGGDTYAELPIPSRRISYVEWLNLVLD